MSIERVNRYLIRIDGCEVPADEQQEAAIRNMTPQQRRDFLAIFGYTDTEGSNLESEVYILEGTDVPVRITRSRGRLVGVEWWTGGPPVRTYHVLKATEPPTLTDSEMQHRAMMLRSDAVRRFSLGMDLPPSYIDTDTEGGKS